MTLLLPLMGFLFVSLLVTAIGLAMARGDTAIERRLGELRVGGALPPLPTASNQRLLGALKRLGNAAPRSSAELGKLRQRLVASGYRGGEALPVFFGIRLGLALSTFGLMTSGLLMKPNLALALGGLAMGYVLPGMALARMAKQRQHRIRLSLPDALDLLVVSVEAGLGLDQALQRVAEELAHAHPELCDELRLINLELRAGKARSEALRNLAERTGVDDLSSLAAMLIQTDKFGTSVARSLRVHSDTLRTKRRQRAEEAAAKTGVKMVFPLVFCIFPAIWVVTIGPAAIKFVEVLFPLAESMTPTLDVPSLAPPVPMSLAETGLPADRVEQLLLKTLYGGELTGLDIAERIRLPYAVLEPLVVRLRTEQLIEVRGASAASSASYRYALTDLGRSRTVQYLEINQYVGPAPVPLSVYVAQVRALQKVRGFVERARLRAGFSHLVIGDDLLEKLGPAVNANKALFLYGPPGNGKTVIAEGLGRAVGGDLFIPYAIEVDGHVITMYDPINHERLDTDTPLPTSVISQAPWDRRWVRIRRPVVMVGGELTLDQLDLTFNPLSKFYEAPLQLRANGGVFLVDDFGRQRIRPDELLNRWIVPLESRVDYLTLHTGKKFEVPFDVLTVFATNLDPASLADEAFLRRIPYKVPVPDPSMDDFARIFELNCRSRGFVFHPDYITYLLRRHYGPSGRPLRACHPRDLLDQALALCRYRGVEPSLNEDLLDAACAAYFIHNELSPGSLPARRSTMPSPQPAGVQ